MSECGLDLGQTMKELADLAESKNKQKKIYVCRAKGCGIVGHYNSTSWLCPMNKKIKISSQLRKVKKYQKQ